MALLDVLHRHVVRRFGVRNESDGREQALFDESIEVLNPAVTVTAGGSELIRIVDNGCGMDEETVEQVFEPFYTTKTNGSGLGMSIVYRTLKENEAAITVESTEGKGTTFSMFFKSA